MSFVTGAPPPDQMRVVSTDVWRNTFYDDEPVVLALTAGADIATWEVRDYYGTIVATGLGPVGTSLTLPNLGLGWYKLYLHRAVPDVSPWLHNGGSAMFCVVRRDWPGPRPALDSITSNGAPYDGADYPTRAFIGMGPHRTSYTFGNQASAPTANAVADTLLEQSLWPTDPVRPIKQFCHSGDNLTPENEAANGPLFDEVVTDLTAAGCTRFEVMNEPNNFGVSVSRMGEMLEVYQRRMKAVSPAALLLGPCPISIKKSGVGSSGFAWTRDVLAQHGDKIDVISFHNYNGVEGDLSLGRRVMDDFVAMLQTTGQAHKERINSEAFSYFMAVYGSHEHRLQAQWTMLEMHLLEQYGVPKENCSVFYDVQHGFWSYPSWWINGEGTERHPGPLLPIVKVWSEELRGKAFSARLDFGTVDNHDFLGSRFLDPSTGASVIAVQSDGRDASVRFQVTGASAVVVVSPFGATTTRPVTGGWVTVEVSTLPVYLRLPAGTDATPEAVDYGIEAARTQGALATADSAGNGPEKVINGVYENDRYGSVEYRADESDVMPSWVRLDFSTPRRFDRVRVVCPRPWQHSGSILDADVEALVDGTWTAIGAITEDPATFQWTERQALGACYTDSYWARTCKWVFELPEPITASAVRLSVRAVSYGGGATLDTTNHAGLQSGSGGQTGPARLTLREIEVWLASVRGDGVPPDHPEPFVIT